MTMITKVKSESALRLMKFSKMTI